MEGASGPVRGALARLRSAPLWVWITILLTFGLLVFAYLQYRKNSANGSTTGGVSSTSAGLGTVPSDGSGQPLWNTADTSGMVSGNPAELAAILAYLQSLQTPNAPPTASPNPPASTRLTPTFPVLKPAPQVPARSTVSTVLKPTGLPTVPGFWQPRLGAR